MLIKNALKISVALSGGVDSSVVAALFKELGHKVTGVYYKRWSPLLDVNKSIDNCPYKEDLEYIEKTSALLDIPVEVYNFSREYKKQVLTDFFSKYKQGQTPNPDILCNSQIKFDLLLNKELDKGADFLATGHYAGLFKNDAMFAWHNYSPNKISIYDTKVREFFTKKNIALLNAMDPSKDQSYFLAGTPTQYFKKVLFPLSVLFKTEVRRLAQFFNLPSAMRKDSQGICFLGDISVQEFIKANLGVKAGDIIDIESQDKVGEHEGIWFYTIGQRKGLKIGGAGKPYFVVKLDGENNIVYVAKDHSNPLLYKTQIYLKLNNKTLNLPEKFKGYINVRYRNKPILAYIERMNNDIFRATSLSKTKYWWAPATGQYAVIYSNKIMQGNFEPLSDAKEILKTVLNNARPYKKIAILGSGPIVNVENT